MQQALNLDMIGNRRKSREKKKLPSSLKKPDCDGPRKLGFQYIKSPELFVQEPSETRPKTRGECVSVPRPCPYVSCRYNLFLDIKEDGGGGINYNLSKNATPDQMPKNASCALDVADAHTGVGMTLDHIGEFFGINRERIRQIEQMALDKIKRKLERKPRKKRV